MADVERGALMPPGAERSDGATPASALRRSMASRTAGPAVEVGAAGRGPLLEIQNGGGTAAGPNEMVVMPVFLAGLAPGGAAARGGVATSLIKLRSSCAPGDAPSALGSLAPLGGGAGPTMGAGSGGVGGGAAGGGAAGSSAAGAASGADADASASAPSDGTPPIPCKKPASSERF